MIQGKSNTSAKIGLLIWKNSLIQKRHKFYKISNICIIILLFLIYIGVRASFESKNTSKPIKYQKLSLDNQKSLWINGKVQERRLLFAPNSTLFQSLMNRVSEKLSVKGAMGCDLEDLETIFQNRKPIAAVIFHHPDTLTDLPKTLSYSLRFPSELRETTISLGDWSTNRLFPVHDFFDPKNLNDSAGSDPSYYKEGFLTIQNAIAMQFIGMMNSTLQLPDIQVKRFPYPPYASDIFLMDMGIVSICMLLYFNHAFTHTIQLVSTEKEKRLKEAMKIVGLPMWIHWFSWFIRTIAVLSKPMFIIAILLKVPLNILPNSNFFCLLTFLNCYCICITVQSFVISSIFSTARIATFASSFVWYSSFLPFIFTYWKYDEVPDWMKVLIFFCPNAGLGHGFLLIGRLEKTGLGLSWTTFFDISSVYDTVSVGFVCIIMLLSSILFFGFILCMENTFSSECGITKPWRFLFKRDFWQYETLDGRFEDEFLPNETIARNFGREPMDRRAAIRICHLSKMYGNELVVDNLTLNLFENQITVLLGQNGAGKTTTLSMLLNMIEPSSGTAIINGFDIRRHGDMARNSIGFCPQNNILFDELTIKEHIMLYSQLKGMNEQESEMEVEHYASLLGLQFEVNTISKLLSDVQQRKLSIGIALCGHSETVILDEPTSGMDVNERRALWNILSAEKENRTILLTTHFMDEADVLGDRIAIIAEGELQCCGSPFFLKKRFGTGYHLICAKDDDCDSDEVTELLSRHLPEIQIENENDSEICYGLPDDTVYLFKNIFKDLEDNETRLKIKSFGVSLTTLESIFLKFAKGSAKVQSTDGLSNHGDVLNEDEMILALEDEEFFQKGCGLLMSQALAMFKKRYLCWLRSWQWFFYYNLVVLILLVPVAFDLLSRIVHSDLPSLDLTLDSYKSPIIFVEETKTLNESSIAFKILSQLSDDIQADPEADLITISENVDNDIITLADASLLQYKTQYLTAASAVDNNTILAWFNNQALHSAGISLSLVHNAFMKLTFGSDYGFCVTNEPFPSQANPNKYSSQAMFAIWFELMIGISMSIYSAMYIMFYTKERNCKSKLLQYISGANTFVFWISSIIWDLISCTFTITMIIVILAISKNPGYSSFMDLVEVFVILFLFSCAMLPIMCLMSLFFAKPAKAVSAVVIINKLVPIVLLICDDDCQLIPYAVRLILMAHPMCLLDESFDKFAKFKLETIKKPNCCGNVMFGWEEPYIGHELVSMIGVALISFTILIVIECDAFKQLISSIIRWFTLDVPEKHDEFDSDVADEKMRIDAMSETDLKSEALVMQDVSKFYSQFMAVNRISLAVRRAECFGLLGSNGAGITTIFKMIIGEVLPSHGKIFINGYDQKYDLHKIYGNIGYCPQTDALLNELTCRETLEIYAMLHGISCGDVKRYVQCVAYDLDFVQHIDKKVSQLSGGNKRKLSIAISLIGNPSIILLDEPTTGMDPATKRHFWDVINKLRENGKSIILASHSMEECEALCTRLTVLVNGDFKCLGSVQHLKNKFTNGFELKVKIHAESLHLAQVKRLIFEKFDGATLRSVSGRILTFVISTESVKWSTAFEIMENAKKTIEIEDYSISQKSLERVVLSLIENQRPRKNIK